MPLSKTEQEKRKRAEETAERTATTQGRRYSAAAAQSRSEQRLGRNVDEGSAEREANFTARENASGLNSLGNNTMSGRTARNAANPDFPQVGTPTGNDFFESTNNVGGGGGGGGGGGADGADGFGGSSPLYQDGAYTGPFAIKINGSYATGGEGADSQNSSFTIGVEGGTGTWPTSGAKTFAGTNTSASAADEFYRIYGKITADRQVGGKTLDLWTNPSISVVTATTGDTIGSNTRYINNGSDYTFYFLIGTVGITVQPSGGYKIFVNQIQIGNYTYGTAHGSGSDADGNDTRDGIKNLTICINGTPYTADFELTNIVKVT